MLFNYGKDRDKAKMRGETLAIIYIASPGSCKVRPVFHHASTQFLLLLGVIQPLLQRQAKDKFDFVAVDHAHPLWPCYIWRSVVKEVYVHASLKKTQKTKNRAVSSIIILFSFISPPPHTHTHTLNINPYLANLLHCLKSRSWILPGAGCRNEQSEPMGI